ncbi:NAD kinase [Marinicauda algicola]|uniref:NAD kinase n=1 Tax=Marinicauda algicola TaxID=2029849 RepID=A0A4S2H2R9_9PROT|nr:NAD kinase [Marinicauda algicola]TGY89631.1 NAD kinase [Marinicauda algicola]
MKIAFHAGTREDARSAKQALADRHGEVALDEAEVLVALGGDGVMLDALHKVMGRDDIRVYGINFGSVGFLMNEPSDTDLIERLERAEQADIHPLRAVGERVNGERFEVLAINEVSLLRETRQTAKIRISIDGTVRMEELSADGALVATPAGSTAYNFSAHGPILPLDAQLLALTPISAFRPRRWRGALLPHDSVVEFEVLEPEKRPVSAVADNKEFREARRVTVSEAGDITLHMLFDEGRALEERILVEQFST